MMTVMPSFMTPALTANFTGFLASVHPLVRMGAEIHHGLVDVVDIGVGNIVESTEPQQLTLQSLLDLDLLVLRPVR